MTEKIDTLLEIMAMLRDREHGCPWDIKQNFKSIAPHTLEEVYEVIECIEHDDYQHLCNELGDLLFQVVFYAQMASEEELFDFDDICDAISHKLLSRHPHVFPDATIESFGKKSHLTPEQVEANWETIKRQEKQQGGSDTSHSLLDDVPQALPALLRARKLQGRAAHGGFDWNDRSGVIGKLKEEIQELEEALAQGNKDSIDEEYGDVLFSMVNLARHLRLNPESSLRGANNKFNSRFRLMEQLLEQANCDMQKLSLDELEDFWLQAKEELKESG